MAAKTPSASVVARKAQVNTNAASTRATDTHTQGIDTQIKGTQIERRAVSTKKAEEAQAILAAIVQSSEDAIVSKDLNGIIQSWNEGATRMFGYTEQEAIGRPVTILMPPERADEELGILERIRKGERVEHYETVRQRKDGTLVDISLTISPVRDRQGHIVGASKIARDITSRKQAEQVLRRTEKLAATGRLAATMAHEINNPLESITNLLYLVQKESMSPVARQHLELIEREIDRVVHVAKQTLGFYRDSASKDWVNVSQEVSDILEIYGYKFRSRDMKVQSDLDDAAKVFAAAGEFRQVFSNLFINAVDALPQHHGRVLVKVRKARDWADHERKGVRITLGDTGSGIGPEQMTKIFEPFYTTKPEIGTGLGLWLSKSIVEKHGGRMRLRSRAQPGRSGTVFTVFWPESTEVAGANKNVQPGQTKNDDWADLKVS
jgi:two-component system CheB/CheR fusion protein